MPTATARSADTAASTPRELPPSMLERMTLILDAFDKRTTRLTLEEVARHTHLPRSTAHRILDQLVGLNWLEHTASGYGLGTRALELGGSNDDHSRLREAAAPLLHTLQLRTGMVVHLAVLDGTHVYYLDKVGGRFAAAVPSRVGGYAPAHSTALGKAILAWLQPERIDERVAAAMVPMTSHTIAAPETLHQELARIRSRDGLAFEYAECFPNITCAAAAIRGPEGPVGSISLVGDAHTALETVAPLVVRAAREVSTELFSDARDRGSAQPYGALGRRTAARWHRN